MNKKFLSAILFGALMVTSTGTFVSCKDYDDDIENLQSQINNLATKSDVEAKLSQLQAAIEAAKSEALKAAASAEESAEIAALEAKIAALGKCECDLEAMMKEIQDAVDADMAEYKKEIDALIKEAEELVGKVADFVTSVELVYSYGGQQTSYWTSDIRNITEDLNEWGWFERTGDDWNQLNYEVVKDDDGTVLGYSYDLYYDRNGYMGRALNNQTVVEKDNKFGTETSFIEFTKGAQVQRGDKFIVRVSPTNAVLTPENVTLVNSLGESLDILKVTEVKPYKGLLTRAEGNGLWEVSVELKKYDKDEFKASVLDANGYSVAFAVAVNNTLSTAETRKVISSYDLSLVKTNYYGQSYLAYFVDATPVMNINNRVYGCSSKSLAADADKNSCYKEMVWMGDAAVAAITEGEGQNVYFPADNRGQKDIYPAVQGVPMTISLSAGNYLSISNYSKPDVKAMYITLDTKNAVESAPSELNAWNSYTYTGLNTIVEGTTAQITINAASAINDVIGFRVYAVNWDGTLVDPDGKAFYVRLGSVATNWNAAATTIVPTSESMAITSDKVAVSLTKVAASKATWATDKIKVNGSETQPVFNAVFVDADGNVLYNTATPSSFPADFSKVAKVYTVPTLGAWYNYADGKAYNGKLTIYNSTNHVVATMNISMTKNIPTTVPSGFTFKDKQLIDGIYNCYLEATDWTAGDATLADGEMTVANFIHFGTGTGANYELTFATSAPDADGDGVLNNVTANGAGKIEVTRAFVDNKTEHASKIVYNYGKISSEAKNDAGAIVDYKVLGAEFKTVWCCFYKSDVHTWGWATRAQLGSPYTVKDADGNYTTALPYNTTLEYASNEGSHIAYVFGQNAIDGEFTKALNNVYLNSLKVKSAKLISDATEKEDYFSVSSDLSFTAIKTDLGSNPKADVPSTLIITCEDYYGHEIVIKLAMTVKPRK